MFETKKQIKRRMVDQIRELEETIEKMNISLVQADKAIAAEKVRYSNLNEMMESKIKQKDEKIKWLECKNEYLKTSADSLEKAYKENNELKDIILHRPMKLTELPVEEIMGAMMDKAWYGDNSERIYNDLNGRPVIRFRGHTYEPGYESFSATCAVYGYDKTGKSFLLFDEEDYSADAYLHKVHTSGSKELIFNYLKENDDYVILCS